MEQHMPAGSMRALGRLSTDGEPIPAVDDGRRSLRHSTDDR
jgi:hypothetical protein